MKRYRKYRDKSEVTDMIARSELAANRVEALRLNITKSERRVMILLDELSIEYIFQYACFDEWFFIIADFFVPSLMLMIEVDGDSHESKKQKLKEAKRKRWLAKQGIKVLRIKNKATIKLTAKQLNGRILRCISKNNNKKC